MRSGVVEAGGLGDPVDRLVGGLDADAGGLQAQALDGLGGGEAGLGGEGAGEVARAHGGLGGQALDVQRLGEALAHPVHQGGEPAMHAAGVQQGGELRLAARPAVVHHELLGRCAGHLRAQVVLDQRQGQVDAGGDPRRGPGVALAHEDPVGLQADGRIAPGEFVGAAPVGGGPLAVQQAGLGQQIGARTDAGHPPGPGRGRLQPGDDLRQVRQRPRAVAAGDHDGVDGSVVQRVGGHLHAGGAGDGAAVGGQDRQLVGVRPVAPGDLEGGDRAGGVQQLEVGKDHEGDAAGHGSKRGKNVISARR